jgi:hypothetical protein
MAVDLSKYESQRRNIGNRFGAEQAANQFSRTLAQQRVSKDIGNATRGFQQGFPSFQASFGQRGLTGPGVQSGTHERALQQYLGEHTRGIADLQLQGAQQQQQFDLNSAQLQAYRDQALAELEMQKQSEIANTASALMALRPYMGGF